MTTVSDDRKRKKMWPVTALVALLLSTGGCSEEEAAQDLDEDDVAREEATTAETDEPEDERDAGPKLDSGAKPAARDAALDSRTPTTPTPVPDAGAALPEDNGPDDASTLTMGDAGAAVAERADLGEGDGKDVIAIGDSWMSFLGTGIQQSLVRVSGQPYRTYGFPGTRVLNDQIPDQYASAKRADPDIKTVVMTGGGNDVIQKPEVKADCEQGGELCTAELEKIGLKLAGMWKQMSDDGVQDVIHVMYSSSAGSGVKNREENNMKTAERCAAVPAPLRCHLLNTDMLIGPSDIRGDGIHPTDRGYDKIGKAVFELMVEKGMRR